MIQFEVARRVRNVLREILKKDCIYSYGSDLVIGSSVLYVNITKINQCNLIGGKKVNVNISLCLTFERMYCSYRFLQHCVGSLAAVAEILDCHSNFL